MIDPEIENDINTIRDYVTGINHLMQTLHERGVEVKIAYKEHTPTASPRLELWRATEHIDYLKKE